MTKIAAVATRRFTRNGEQFAKGEKLSLTEGEFAQLDLIGFVEKPKETKAAKPD